MEIKEDVLQILNMTNMTNMTKAFKKEVPKRIWHEKIWDAVLVGDLIEVKKLLRNERSDVFNVQSLTYPLFGSKGSKIVKERILECFLDRYPHGNFSKVLEYGCLMEDMKVVTICLDRDIMSKKALYICVANNRLQYANLLLHHKADPNAAGILQEAATSISTKMVNILLEAGADPNRLYIVKQGVFFETNLYNRTSKLYEIIRNLIYHGWNVYQYDNDFCPLDSPHVKFVYKQHKEELDKTLKTKVSRHSYFQNGFETGCWDIVLSFL
jgi:hypothetical protein